MRGALIAAAVEEFKNAFTNVRIFFATKCNTDPGVLRVLHTSGTRFEVASVDEINTLRSLGVHGQNLLFSNPVRAREQTREAARAGVYRFSVDSPEELHRVADEAPGSCVYARLATGDRPSLVPSEGKFGIDVPGAIDLLVRARALGLVPYGITFHIGSQSLTPGALTAPLADVHAVLAGLVSHGIRLQMVDIGGGFPAVYDRPVPSLAAFGQVTAAGIAQLPYRVEVFAEPGRCLVAEAGTFRCRVIGVARRASGWWVHTDLGVFNGMMEVLESAGELTGSCVSLQPTCDCLFHPLRGSLVEWLLMHPRWGFLPTKFSSQFIQDAFVFGRIVVAMIRDPLGLSHTPNRQSS